ncbi:glycosyltransferase family 2 protein [Methylomicrobium lacus]|uniref:glycosyltransferase family 2 protein n=1 Tax=Methylomicrobium lacus TaxID=136992 RepID=UPI00045EC234|nr:glycosyltransferase family 2 protein [Methylomicrobium lacus]
MKMDFFIIVINGDLMRSVIISIIIVNWNSKIYLQKCIASILKNTFGIEYEIIVVDSGSFDGCGLMLQHFYPEVRFIQSEQNVGFARANNLGSEYARGNVMLFLNPDTEVSDCAIERLCTRLLELPHAGVLGCRLLNSDGSLQTSCVMPFPTILNQIFDSEILQRWFPKVKLWMSAAMFEDVTSPVPVEAVSGACMIIQRDTFERVDGFSADYFMYAEDIDLCYKTCKAGFINYYAPEVEIVHHGGGSTQLERSIFSDIMISESVSRLLRKTRGNFYSLGYRLALCGSAIVRLMLLALCFPVALIKSRTSKWSVAFNKWIAIFRWGLGLEKWVQQYSQPGQTVAELSVGHEK